MSKELTRFLTFMRPAFSRRATHVWFVVVFAGLLARNDTLGVTSALQKNSPTTEFLGPCKNAKHFSCHREVC